MTVQFCSCPCISPIPSSSWRRRMRRVRLVAHRQTYVDLVQEQDRLREVAYQFFQDGILVAMCNYFIPSVCSPHVSTDHACVGVSSEPMHVQTPAAVAEMGQEEEAEEEYAHAVSFAVSLDSKRFEGEGAVPSGVSACDGVVSEPMFVQPSTAVAEMEQEREAEEDYVHEVSLAVSLDHKRDVPSSSGPLADSSDAKRSDGEGAVLPGLDVIVPIGSDGIVPPEGWDVNVPPEVLVPPGVSACVGVAPEPMVAQSSTAVAKMEQEEEVAEEDFAHAVSLADSLDPKRDVPSSSVSLAVSLDSKRSDGEWDVPPDTLPLHVTVVSAVSFTP